MGKRKRKNKKERASLSDEERKEENERRNKEERKRLSDEDGKEEGDERRFKNERTRLSDEDGNRKKMRKNKTFFHKWVKQKEMEAYHRMISRNYIE